MKIRSMTSQFQTLLYSYPLYEYIQDTNINILIIGWSRAAQTFLDLALEAGQIAKRTAEGTVWYKPRLTISAPQPDERYAEYRVSRRDLENFVAMSSPANPGTENPDSYGTVRMIDGNIFDLLSSTEYQYVVICGDTVEACEKIGSECAQALDLQPGAAKSMIVLAAAPKNDENGFVLVRQGQAAGYLPVADDEAEDAKAKHLQDLAFNAHLVWGLQPNGDIEEQRNIFNDPNNDYFRRSSRSFVASIQSKLWCIGIKSSTDLENARAFQEKMNADRNHVLFHLLMAMEQRRWIMEKVTQGYYNGYHRGKDEENTELFEELVGNASLKNDKMNLYILRCNEDAKLDDDPVYWKDESKIDDLDDLDFLSVDYYRFVCGKRDKLRTDSGLFSTGDIANLRSQLDGLKPSIKLKAELNRYIFCLHAILDGSQTYAKQYHVIAQDFLNMVSGHCSAASNPLLALAKKNIENTVNNLYKQFYPAIEAALHRSFKMNNEALIRNIPFVLTYQASACLVMPFDATLHRSEINDHIYNNLVSPMIIKPRTLVYLYQAQNNTDVRILADTLKSCVVYLKRYRIPCEVHLVVSHLNEINQNKAKNLRNALRPLSDNHFLSFHDLKEHADSGFNWINETILYDGTTPLFASMQENAKWVDWLSNRCGYFELDAAPKKFTFTTASCEWLKYIPDRSFLRVDDMLRLMGGENRDYKYPDYTEMTYASANDRNSPVPLYQRLWEIYNGKREMGSIPPERSISQWNIICSVLERRNLQLLGAGFFEAKKGISFSRLWEPGASRKAQYLQKADIEGVTNLLKTLANIRDSRREPLLSLKYESDGSIQQIYSDHKGMIDILSQAGMILEVYTYFKAFETGYFDDIACSCEFFWGDYDNPDSQKNNEIDLILTKDFRSVIVECKGTASLDQNYFHKLNSLADIFGINAKKVIVAYTHNNNAANEQNQVDRGKLMDIITINDAGQIDQIGNRLKNIMKS